jgi:hypothetical protein
MLAGALAAVAMKVTTDYSHSADFGQYKTYSWLKVEADPLWVDRIQSAVDAKLLEKGWTKVADGGDAAVSAFVSTATKPEIRTFYDTFGGGWYWRDFGDGVAYTTVDNIPIGTLVVDIFDTATKKLIWRGVGTDTISDKPSKNEKKLEKAVDEMFAHFPPKSKG